MAKMIDKQIFPSISQFTEQLYNGGNGIKNMIIKITVTLTEEIQ